MSRGPSSGSSPEASPVRVRRGEALDVLIMVDSGMEALVRTGHFVPQHRRNVAVSRIGVAVKAGQPLPDIAGTEAFRKALIAARSVGYSEGASGMHFIKVVVPKLGLADVMAAKGHVVLGRRFVGEDITDGVIELGVQQISELHLAPGITVVGPLPEELQKLSVVSAAVSSRAAVPAAVRQFLDFLGTPFAQQAIRDSGIGLCSTWARKTRCVRSHRTGSTSASCTPAQSPARLCTARCIARASRSCCRTTILSRPSPNWACAISPRSRW